MNLELREKELQELADKRGVDWKGPLKKMPSEGRLRIMALATLLGLHPLEALHAEGSLKKREAEAHKRRRVTDAFVRSERKALQGPGPNPGEGA